ncbi:MAG TPA: NPCBM/NEW2 domain-containing protein [Phycisphaerae bacterium]|nr:NPCBM/NEW2 domain-containing protein [Phycisphaerae bacterium]
MNGPGHNKVVSLAFQCLPRRKAAIWEPLQAHAAETCMLPDQHAIDLLEGRGGPWRRYYPQAKPINNFLVPGRDLRRLLPPTRFYARRVIANLRKGDLPEAGRFAGVFSHYLADFAQPAHYYELDVPRLLPAPRNMANCNLHRMIEDIESTVERISYRARLLGASLAEFVFRFEGRLAKLHEMAVAAIVPMLTQIYRRRNDRAAKVFDGIVAETARVFADFCYSACALAAGDLPNRVTAPLASCDLREIAPHAFDVEYNHGYRPLVDAITVGNYERAQPLRLLVRRRGRAAAEVVTGICVIPHALPVGGATAPAMLEYRLPAGTFRRFEASVGLLAAVERQAKCRFEVVADGRCVYRSGFLTAKDAARPVRVDVGGVRRLRLLARSDGSTDKLAYAIWAAPRLHKE